MCGVRWDAVDALVDRAAGPRELIAHRLHLIAARRARELGRAVDPEIAAVARLAAVQSLALAPLLARARTAYDGRMLVMKGPVVAARYRDPATRPYKDVDLLVDDAAAAQRALVAAGFVEVGESELYVDIHHLRPLAWPGLALTLELHSEPKWVPWSEPPGFDELAEAALPGRGPLDGYLCPLPEHHAVLLATHGWAHEPLRRLGDLLDVAVAGAGTPRGEAAVAARAWGCERLWRTTERAADALFAGTDAPASVRVWGRHLPQVRERSVFETHLARWLDPLWTAPSRPARSAVRAMAADLRPSLDEGWRPKLARARRAARGARMEKSTYDGTHEVGDTWTTR